MEFPITINDITFGKGEPIKDPFWSGNVGDYVSIRPCDEELGGKTFLGILLGEVALGLSARMDEEKQALIVDRGHYNPAIYVPELKRIVYGCESWWGTIDSEDQLKDITNEDIGNVWYVQALKQIQEAKAKEESTEA